MAIWLLQSVQLLVWHDLQLFAFIRILAKFSVCVGHMSPVRGRKGSVLVHYTSYSCAALDKLHSYQAVLKEIQFFSSVCHSSLDRLHSG